MAECYIGRISLEKKPEVPGAVSPITIQLEQPMRPVLANGEVGEYVAEITVGGVSRDVLLY